MDEAKQEAKVARLVASTAGEARVREEEDMARAQEALAAAEEGRRKAKVGTACLEVKHETPPTQHPVLGEVVFFFFFLFTINLFIHILLNI